MGQGACHQDTTDHQAYDAQGRRLFEVARADGRGSGAVIIVYRSRDESGMLHDPGCDVIRVNPTRGPTKEEAMAAHARLRQGQNPDEALWSFRIDKTWLRGLLYGSGAY